jgi:uncharacterized membrane protein YphA (DoxX/SURF4 family)
MGSIRSTERGLGSFRAICCIHGKANWFLSPAVIPALASLATGAETLLGFCLLVGWYTRVTALSSGILLMSFGVAMTLALGIKAPLDLSVFSVAGGAFLLATCARYPSSVDELLLRSR